MSIKDLFGKRSNQIVTQADLDKLEKDIESTEYAEAKVSDNMRFVPRVTVDFEDPKTFARYGSAEKYYEDAVANIVNTYPYDGSAREKLEWHNNSTYIDNWIFENKYPRTTGYVSFNTSNAFTTPAAHADGYIYRSFTNPQYVTIKGGPHPTPNNPTGKLAKQFPEAQGKSNILKSNILDASKSRESNLNVDPSIGVTIEFWWKKESTSETGIECLFYLTNGIAIGTTDWARLMIEHDDVSHPSSSASGLFKTTLISDAGGAHRLNLGVSADLPSGLTITNWNHYAVVIKNNADGVNTDASLYINGKFVKTVSGNAGSGNPSSTFKLGNGLQASIGAYIDAPYTGTYPTAPFGATRSKFDEFRFWKKARTAEEIGRHWHTQVGGGTNTDDANIELGVYYKFNEGVINSSSAITADSAVLDYSGRLSNGTIANYTTTIRSTASAIEEYDTKKKEFKDPILYTGHPDISSMLSEFKSDGKLHDAQNNSAIYHTLPDWIISEDENDSDGTLKNLTQVIASYFDTLHLQIEALPKLTNSEYTQAGEKPLPFAKKLLESVGFIAPEIFIDSTVLESLVDRNEDILFEDSINNVKNMIYQNIYNNISNIYKSKGTEKSFRNILRCYGVGDELIKINLYGDNVKFKLENNFKSISVKKNYLDYSSTTRHQATCFQFANPSNSDSTSFIAGSTSNQFDYIPFTLEADIIFPKKISSDHESFTASTISTSSLFGMHEANPADPNDLTWHSSDSCGFSVQAIKVGTSDSPDVKFRLTTTTGWGSAYVLESPIMYGAYDNQRWNFAVRLKPDKFPAGLASDTANGTYTLEFYGVNSVLDVVQNKFGPITQSISNANGKFALNAAKRVFAGAEYQHNSSSNPIAKTDVKLGAIRYWLDYLDDDTIKAHARDVTNYGAKHPSRHAYLQTVAGALDMTQADTLALNWDFETAAVPQGSSSGLVTITDAAAGLIGDTIGITTTDGTSITATADASTTTTTDTTSPTFEVIQTAVADPANVLYQFNSNDGGGNPVDETSTTTATYEGGAALNTSSTASPSHFPSPSGVRLLGVAGSTGFPPPQGDSVIIEGVPTLDSEYTIDFWFRMDDVTNQTNTTPGTWQYLFAPSKPLTWGYTGLYLRWDYSNTKFELIHRTNNTDTFGVELDVSNTSISNLVDNTWYHLAITRDSSDNVYIYINGELESGKPSGTNIAGVTDLDISWIINSASLSRLRLGRSHYTNQVYYPFNGYIDEFRIVKDQVVDFSAYNYSSTFPGPYSLSSVDGEALTAANLATCLNANSKLSATSNAGATTIIQADHGTTGNTEIILSDSTEMSKTNFSSNIGSSAEAFFFIEDVASGSAAIASGSWLASALKKQHTGKGDFYYSDDTKAVDRNFIFTAKQQLPESISSSDTVQILEQDDITFTKESRPINHFWAVEKSMYQAISDEMINMFSTIIDFNNLIGNPVNRYRMEYKELGKLRQMFFEKVQNDPSVEKYVEFYKWIDYSINSMIQQLIPASANFSDEMRTMIESHVLERNKYWNKSPTLITDSRNKNPLQTPALGINELLYDWDTGLATTDITKNKLWWKDRAERDNSTITSGDTDVDADRDQILHVATTNLTGSWMARTFANRDGTTYEGTAYALRSLARPYRFGVEKEPTPEDRISPITITNVPSPPPDSAPFGEQHDGTFVENPTSVIDNQMGNYRFPYDIVQTSGRKNNNSWFNSNGGLGSSILTSSESSTVYGHYDFELPNRTAKKHVFVERFSAPGSADTMQRGMLDVEGEEYSAYNSLNFRNLDVRLKLGDWLTKHFEWDSSGPRENFHKIHRNTKYVYQSDGSCAANHDNFWFQHQIPQSGYQYSWINSSVHSQSCPQGFASKYENLAPQHSAIETDPSSVNYGLPVEADAATVLYSFDSGSPVDKTGNTTATYGSSITQPTNSPAHFGDQSSVYFDGTTNSSVEIDYPSEFTLDGEFTIDFWLKLDTVSDGTHTSSLIFGPKAAYATANSMQLNWSHSPVNLKFNLGVRDSSAAHSSVELDPANTSLSSLSDDTWYHFAITRDTSDKIYMYINGEQDSTKTAGFLAAIDFDWGAELNLGAITPTTTFGLLGSIDEFRIVKGQVMDFSAYDYSSTFPGPYSLTSTKEYGFPFLNKFQSWEKERHANSYELIRRIDKDGETITDPLCPVYWSGSLIVGDDILVEADWTKYKSDLTLNEVILHRDGPYQHPSWKQIRGAERNAVRAMRKINIMSTLDNNKQLPDGGYGRSDNTVNYIEPAIAWNRPIIHTVQPLGSVARADLTSTYSNNLEVFANPWLQSRLNIEKKANQMYDLLHKEYTRTGTIKLIDYEYSEYIFPKHHLVTLSRTRDRNTYSEIAGTGSQGYDRRSSEIKTFWRGKPLDRQRTLYSADNHYATALNALGARTRNSSVWALDYFKYTSSGTWCPATVNSDIELVMRGDLAWAGYSQHRGFIYENNSLLATASEHNSGASATEIKSLIAPRPTLQFIHNPNSLMAKEEGWAWKAGELWTNPDTASAHKVNAPWEDSYEHYGQDVRLIGQNYSLIPEYKVSEHMEFYIDNMAGDFLAENNNIFDLPGSVDMATTISRENFFAPTNNPTLATVEYVFEANKATGYGKFSKGYMHNTKYRDISNICIQEPAVDIDSNDTNWKCTKDYPVVLLNASGSSEYIKNHSLDGTTSAVTDKYRLTKGNDQWMSSAITPQLSESNFKLQASKDLYGDSEGMPVGCGPISVASGSYNTWNNLYDWDQWENTFLVSFWVNLDKDAVAAHGDKDIGCISLYSEATTSELIPQDVFGLPDESIVELYNSYATATPAHSSDWIPYITALGNKSRKKNSGSAKSLLRKSLITVGYGHGHWSNQEENRDSKRRLSIFETMWKEDVYPKDTIEQANFYLSDSSDTDKRACWVDSLGNKVYFNASLTTAYGTEADGLPALTTGKWNHVSVLYVGGSPHDSTPPSAMGYDSRYHRVFLWINNRLIESEAPTGAMTTAYTNTGAGGHAQHATNGTLHMGAGVAGTRKIKSFGGPLAGNFTFGKCYPSVLPEDRSFSYTMPEAILPGKVTDLAVFQGGEIELMLDPTSPNSFDETGDHAKLTLPSKWSWLFDNTKAFSSFSTMKSGLVTKLFNSQCVDVNKAYGEWRTNFLDDPDNPAAMEINQDSGTSIQRSTETLKNTSDLIAYYPMGIPYWKNSAEVKILSDDFFDCYSYTDDIQFLGKMMNDHKEHVPTLKLEVDTVKKLLPYNGFYPSQRAVQLGSLFYDSIAPNIKGVNSETSVNDKARTEQAALQPFFAPGILFNTIKSGIAVDWATYKGDYGIASVDMRDRFLGNYSDNSLNQNAIDSFITDSSGKANAFGEAILNMAYRSIDSQIRRGMDESKREQVLLQEMERARKNLKGMAQNLQRTTSQGCEERDFQDWANKNNLQANDPSSVERFTKEVCKNYRYRRDRIRVLSTNYGSMLNKDQRASLTSSSPNEVNSILEYIIQEADRIPSVFKSSSLTGNVSEADLEGTYLDAAPNLRIPFEGLISMSGVPNTYSVDEEHKIFYLSPSNYIERFETTTLLEDAENGDENTYNNLRYPYFEWTGKKDVLYELAMHNFLAEIPNFFLKDGELSSFLSTTEDRFKVVTEVGKTYYMDVDLYKTENFDMTLSPHDGDTVKVTRGLDINAPELKDVEGNSYTTHGRYYGPALRCKSNAKMKDDGFYIEDPAQAPYTPPYFYGTAKARLAFTPTKTGKPTLADIQANTTIEYINEGLDEQFRSKSTNRANTDSWKNTPAYKGRMPIDSSINFFGQKSVKNVTYDATGQATSVSDTDKSSWVISTKFECPTLNFNTPENKEARIYKNSNGDFVSSLDMSKDACVTTDDRNLYGPVSRDPRGTGIWSGYGKLPTKGEGIFMELKESFNFNDFSQEEKEKRKRYVVSLGVRSRTQTLHDNVIILTSPDGKTETISIGQPDMQTSEITPASAATERQASIWNVSKGERLYSKSAKIRTKHTSVFLGDQLKDPNPNIPNWSGKGTSENYDIQAYLGKEHWSSNPFAKIPDSDISAIPKSYDLANAICYYINHRSAINSRFKWRARVRNILKQFESESVGPSAVTRLTDKNLSVKSGIGAVVEIEWTGPVSTTSNLPIIEVQPLILSEAVSYLGIKVLNKRDDIEASWKGAKYKFYEKIQVDGAKFSPDKIGSLIDLCGFNPDTSRIGDLAGVKKLQEAIVMIPFVETKISKGDKDNLAPTVEIDGRNFFSVSNKILKDTAKVVDTVDGMTTEEQVANASYDDSTIANTIRMMRDYNIPPTYDYLTHDAVKPFVMYMFEFSENLNQRDLSDIWQGLMPRCARKATKETQTIEHALDQFNFFEGQGLPNTDNKITWMVFKVKKKANDNYYKITPDSKDDSLFKFDIGESRGITPEYSYNWPYDHCSLIEMARVSGGVSLKPADEDEES